MATPKVSVIAVLCGAEERLEQCLDSILGQNFKSLELICVDCGADDESLRLLQERASDDARVRVICQGDENEGAARNRGLQKAVGEYLFFCEPGDVCDSRLLQEAVAKADSTHADIVVFDFNWMYPDEPSRKGTGVRSKWISGKTDTFSYLNCPRRIMNVARSQLWNKLYRTSFVRKNALRFDEIPTMSGVSFSAVSCATASRIAALSNVLYEHWPGATVGDIEFSADCRLCDVVAVVESVLAQASALSQCEEIKVAIDYFVVDACITALFNFEGGLFST